VNLKLTKGCDFDSNHIPASRPRTFRADEAISPHDDIQQQAQSLSGVSRVAGSRRVDASGLSGFLLLITLVRTRNHDVSWRFSDLTYIAFAKEMRRLTLIFTRKFTDALSESDVSSQL
jgi:hypothetical protein